MTREIKEIVDKGRGNANKGKNGFLGTSRQSLKRVSEPKLSPRGTKNSESFPVEGVNFSFGGKES